MTVAIVNRYVVATLSLPPSVNALTRNVPGIGRVKTRAYKAWVRNAHYSIIAQIAPPRMIEAPYSVTIRLPLRMRGDVSNRVKAIEDALVRAGVMVDDSRVYALTVRRDAEVKPDTCRVMIQTEGEQWWKSRGPRVRRSLFGRSLRALRGLSSSASG